MLVSMPAFVRWKGFDYLALASSAWETKSLHVARHWLPMTDGRLQGLDESNTTA